MTSEELQLEPKLDRDADGLVSRNEVDAITMNKDEVRHRNGLVLFVQTATVLALLAIDPQSLPTNQSIQRIWCPLNVIFSLYSRFDNHSLYFNGFVVYRVQSIN